MQYDAPDEPTRRSLMREAACVAAAMGSERVRAHLEGEPRAVIARPPKLVNLVR